MFLKGEFQSNSVSWLSLNISMNKLAYFLYTQEKLLSFLEQISTTDDFQTGEEIITFTVCPVHRLHKP